MKKNVLKKISLVLAAVLCCGLLVGCGGTGSDEKTIRIGASPSPHAEILEQVKAEVEAKGYKLEIIEYNDYVLPNTAVFEGELDANFFQHKPYLDNFNTENKTDLVSVANIHFEPLGIDSSKVTKLEDIPAGGKIGVPNDATNEARALLLLEAQGFITLKEGAGINATINDIETNVLGLEIVEIEAAQLPRSLQDLDAAVINGNYAMQNGLTSEDSLAIEGADSVAATTYGNIVAVKAGNEAAEGLAELMEVLQGEAVAEFINSTYGGAVAPMN